MADSIYTQYHSSLLSTQAASAPQAHQSRKAVFARLAQPFIGTSRPPSSSGNGPAMGSGGSGGGPGSVTSAPYVPLSGGGGNMLTPGAGQTFLTPAT